MKVPAGYALGRREAAWKEYKLMMHTHSPFHRVEEMRKGVLIDAHSIGVCAHRTAMEVFCASSRQTGGL